MAFERGTASSLESFIDPSMLVLHTCSSQLHSRLRCVPVAHPPSHQITEMQNFQNKAASSVETHCKPAHSMAFWNLGTRKDCSIKNMMYTDLLMVNMIYQLPFVKEILVKVKAFTWSLSWSYNWVAVICHWWRTGEKSVDLAPASDTFINPNKVIFTLCQSYPINLPTHI